MVAVECAAADSTFEEIAGWVGCLSAWLLFLSPIPTMRTIVRRRSVGDYAALPYLISFLQCIMWTIYALPWITPCKVQPLVTNGVGSVLQLTYVLVFIRFSDARGAMILRLLALVAIAAIITVLSLLLVPHLKWLPHWPDKDASSTTTFLGWVCAVFNVGMYAAPLGVVRTVIRRRSVRSMPLLLTLGCGLCSTCWTGYALLSSPPDAFILAPNLAGLVLFLLQITVYRCYSPFCARISDDDEDDLLKQTDTLASNLVSPVADETQQGAFASR